MDQLAGEYTGFPGFLGTRGSLMLDLVFVAMFAVVPVMFASIYLVRSRQRYELHRRIQLVLGAVLALAVAAFEIDMRVHGWRERAMPSPYWRDGAWNDPIDWSLGVHLAFAVPTAVLWMVVIIRAQRNFPRPAQPSAHSAAHRTLAWLAALEMTGTAITGWVFYYFAFYAT